MCLLKVYEYINAKYYNYVISGVRRLLPEESKIDALKSLFVSINSIDNSLKQLESNYG